MQVERWLQHGPYKIELEEECLCKNNSKGLKCGSCVSGFFDLADSCSRFVTCFYTFVLVLVLFLVGNRAINGWPVLVPVLGHRCSCGSRCQRVPFLSLFSMFNMDDNGRKRSSVARPGFRSKFFLRILGLHCHATKK